MGVVLGCKNNAGGHNEERATPNHFIFRHSLEHFFPRKSCRISTIKRIRSIMYHQRKIKRCLKAENIILRAVGFADWFMEFKRYSKFAPKSF